MKIRGATAADVFVLAQMRWDFYLEDGDRPASDTETFLNDCAAFIAEGIASGRWHHFVAEQNESIVAMASVQIVPLMPRPSRTRDALGYLTNVYAIPTQRNQGIGETLMKEIRSWAQSTDLELLVVWPSEKSWSLYRRVGFSDETDILELNLRGSVEIPR